MRGNRYRQEQIRAWLSEWQQSGQSIHKFCEDKPFYGSTFRQWIRKSGIDSKHDNLGGFVRVAIQRPEVTPQLVINYPNGLKVEMYYDLDVTQLKMLGGC